MDFEEYNNIKGIWKIATQSQKVMTLGLHRFFSIFVLEIP